MTAKATATHEVRRLLARHLGAPAASSAAPDAPAAPKAAAARGPAAGPSATDAGTAAGTDVATAAGTGVGAPGAGRHAEAALAALTLLCERGLLAPLVEELAADADTASAEAAARARLSYRHALGFHKTMLLAGPPAYMLRAHVWQPAERPPADAAGPAGPGIAADPAAVAGNGEAAVAGDGAPPHVHNHRFAFSSAVLRGALRMRLYVPDPDAAPMAAYREEIAGDDAEWRIRRSGSRGMRMAADLRMAAGSTYCLDADACHQVLPVREGCSVTVFLETATRRAATDVYAPPGAPVPAGTPKEPLAVPDYATALRELRTLMTG